MPKIHDLTPAATLDGSEEAPVHQGSGTVKATLADVAAYTADNLPASGVTAGTYGDSTNVGTFTVGADGRITSASNVGVSGGGGGTTIASVCNGLLTLTSGVAVTTSDVTGATTLYFTPYKGAQIGLYNGTSWDVISFAETSIALGTLTSGKNYDVFAYNNSGTLALELSAAWTSDTARADALALQDGIYCKSGTLTRRYLGTFRTTSTTTTEDSAGGVTSQVGGKRFLWNYYNRLPRSIGVIDTTASWSYTTNTWRQANGASGNKVEVVVGVSEIPVVLRLAAGVDVGNSSRPANAGIGLDSTSTPQAYFGLAYTVTTGNGTEMQMMADFNGYVAAGYHYFSWMEKGGATVSTFLGQGADNGQSRMTGYVIG